MRRSFLLHLVAGLWMQIFSSAFHLMPISQLRLRSDDIKVSATKDTLFVDNARVNIVCVVEKGSKSPNKNPVTGEAVTWEDVMQQIARKVKWADERQFLMQVIPISSNDMNSFEHVRQNLTNANILISNDINDAEQSKKLISIIHESNVPTRLILNSTSELHEVTKLGTFYPSKFSGFPRRLSIFRSFFGGGSSVDRSMYDLVKVFYNRYTSEDLTFMVLSLINNYVTPVPAAKGLGKKGGIRTLACILRHCRKQLTNCNSDPQCKACFDCLKSCPPNDQVCAYRCITSYETDMMEQFSLCVLTKHNCLRVSAEIPSTPDPAPLEIFRGERLNFDTAEDILIGWLQLNDQKISLKPWSWKIVCGQNPAYDFFPNQHQIFYRGRGNGRLWYDPVFQVHTIDGKSVWRRRHYSVRRGKVPGTFHFSVLDNGVTSNEFWRIVDVADDMSWACFFYSGAASAAGQSYTGAVLGTIDGEWPAVSSISTIEKALRKCGIELWEMHQCTNTNCLDAPLDIPEQYQEYQTRPSLALET